MATLNEQGNIIARCAGCEGSVSTFEWRLDKEQYGGVIRRERDYRGGTVAAHYRLFRCAGCGRGALGVVLSRAGHNYPEALVRLVDFLPEALERMRLPSSVPEGIKREFREAEKCLEAGCLRAASGLFRSTLEKALRASGYRVSAKTSLQGMIDLANQDGAITKARRDRAHKDIRVLGNDVLHDDWREIEEEEVTLAHHYTQRLLEDLYDDRATVIHVLQAAGRVPDELAQSAGGNAATD